MVSTLTLPRHRPDRAGDPDPGACPRGKVKPQGRVTAGRAGGRSGYGPLLVGGARAGPDLQAGAVGAVVAGDIDTLVGRRVDDVPPGGHRPLLVRPTGARPQLQLTAVGRAPVDHVQALAQG